MTSVNEFRNVCVVDLNLKSITDNAVSMNLHNVLVVDEIPAKLPKSDFAVNEYSHLADLPLHVDGNSVDLLIGQDHSEALVPLKTRKGKPGEPFAVKTLFGWALNGTSPVASLVSQNVVSNFISCHVENHIENQVQKLWDIENSGLSHDDVVWSYDDEKVIAKWENEIAVDGGHYVLPVPWKTDVTIPNNFPIALSRVQSLKSSLLKRGLFDSYNVEIQKLLDKGYAEKVPQANISKSVDVWYLPHHLVLSDKKPGKLRVVFDCASKFMGESLNDKCLKGPNLTNKLLHVLLRFRRHQFVVMSDIEAMYYQVKVPEQDRDYLRFLWFDAQGDVVTYRMVCHVFGGVWSASAATYALRRTVHDYAIDDPVVTDAVQHSFYVDDSLQSFKNRHEALDVTARTCEVLAKGGFRLTKFVTNDEEILQQLPEKDRASEVKDFINASESKALGVKWNPKSDNMYFEVQVKASEVTRRKILSIMSSTFDPLGLINPVLLPAKILFQDVSRLKYSWDELLPEEIQNRWLRWIHSLAKLKDIEIPRCIKPCDFDDAYLELHHFADASERAYACCSYLRCVNKRGDIHVNLLCSKSKIAPIKSTSIPRLELQAALLAVRVDAVLRKELHLNVAESKFWTDSQIVLQYLANDTHHFHVFVANRVAEIRNHSKISQWEHIAGAENPADLCTREQTPEKLQSSDWFTGPKFLHTYKSEWCPEKTELPELHTDDPEVKSFVTDAEVHPLDTMIAHYSKWYSLKRAVAWWMRFKCLLKSKRKLNVKLPLSVAEIKEAEVLIILHVQQQCYAKELKMLKEQKHVNKSSSIKDLSPMLDSQGILRVGGRIKNAYIEFPAKHPCILPSKHPVSEMVVRELHNVGHLGTEWTLSLLRRTFWITQARAVIKKVRNSCLTCKKLYAAACVQKMADLPSERLCADKPPFSFVGVDCFGPFMVKVGRSEVKRYGCIFTCLTVRAVHIEKLDSLNTDSFINGFRRFIARRGMPLKVWSDNGTNFVGAFSELSKAMRQLDAKQIESYGTKLGIEWSFNPPHSSHMGGIWERLIRVIRRVFNAILLNSRLNDEILSTLFAEAEGIVNSRPLTKISDSASDPVALTPNHLLLLRDGPGPPPGEFDADNLYSRRWRYVQNLANQFWKRWVREYVPELVKRHKWLNENVNLKVNDLVLIKDESTPRCLWPLGLIVKVIEGRDGLVRTVHVRTKSTVLVRPVTKIVMLEHYIS
jgi:hypothetical protein